MTIRGRIAGLARCDSDVIDFLRQAGLPDASMLLEQPKGVEWRGGTAHHYAAD
ncbi:hypothetical protein [Streptomyces sp. NPDC086010]|uniref:hypothetical protein n=1 Tax=Streptomyces sp. NPDC086010 TaxID=3365745 RepID=UPI0037D3B8B4